MRYLTVFIYSMAMAIAVCTVPIAFDALAQAGSGKDPSGLTAKRLRKGPHKKRGHRKTRKLSAKKSHRHKHSALRKQGLARHKKAA